MSDTARRVGSVLAAVLIVAAALGWGAVHEQTLVVAARVRAKSTAREVLARAAEAIAELPAPVAEQARAFGDYDALAKMLAQTTNAPEDIAQLAQTLKNTEAEEQWLRSWTDVGTVALALNGAVVFVSGGQALPAAVQALIPRAQTERVASLVAIDGAPWLVGLSPSRQPGAQLAVAVAIMIVPLDVRRLSTAAQKAGATVSVFFGERDLSAGDAVQANQLKAFRQAGALEQEPCCAIAPLVGEVKLGVYVDPSAVIAGAQAVASRDRVAAGIVGGLLAALVLGLGLRRGRSAADEHGQLLRETAAELQRSREEMQRLSQRISSGGLALPAPATESGLEQTAAAIQVSRYQLVAPLGEGGMARVVVAQTRGAEGFRRLFVVKRLRPELASNQEIVNQFIDEARLGASFVHSNIVPVFDFGRDAEGYFIAQEYILGRDLDAVVRASKAKRGRALEPGVVLYLAQEALKALSYAHTRCDDTGRPLGLVHRDVSPNNLMLSARGELKLLDFGIVKSDQRLTHTQTGVVKGNLFFMSPEQARAERVDARSDLFSLGLVMFTAATGELLYSGDSSYELLTRSGAAPTAADWVRVEALVPPPLAGLIRRALQPLPSERYADADEFAHAVGATAGLASAAEVQALMQTLFKDDFAAETNRLTRPT